MKIYLCLVIAVLTGCAGFDFSLDCRLTENRLVCNGEFPDGGNRETDSGIDSSMPAVDSGLDAGQSVDTSVPSVDSSSPDATVLADTGTPRQDSGASDARVDSAVVDAGPVVVVPATGVFRVVGSKLFDPNGVEFRIRGTNKTHQDNWSPGLGKTKSNTTRWLVYFTETPDRTIADLQSPNIGGSTVNGRAVAIPGFWDGTCKSDMPTFNTMVNRWVRDVSKFKAIQSKMILNIANEWGDNEVAWRDAYVAALPKIRAAGWTGAIMVDAPGCGQNGMAIARHGAAVLAADPLKNVIFDWHIYGLLADTQGGIAKQWSDQMDLVPTFDAIAATGLAVVVGEFGPGRNIGPSPTMVKPERIMDLAEARGMGWLSWSWDDNDGPDGTSTNNSFSHSYTGDYNSPSDLTDFGKIVVGYWDRLAVRASTL